jgi:hypothetical protein
MLTKLFRLTGWRMFRPRRAPWGESTHLWSNEDWKWFREIGSTYSASSVIIDESGTLIGTVPLPIQEAGPGRK